MYFQVGGESNTKQKTGYVLPFQILTNHTHQLRQPILLSSLSKRDWPNVKGTYFVDVCYELLTEECCLTHA